MTAPTPQMTWAGNLQSAIEQASSHNVRPARHVLARLAALLYPLEVKHIDAGLQAVDDRMARVTGTITLFTEQLVAVTVVKDMLVMPTGREHTDVHEPTDVQITVVPRTDLRRVGMVEAGTGWAAHNGSPDWHANAGEFTEWPYTGRVSFGYEGLAEPVVMPSGRNVGDFQTFLPELMADLSR